MQHLPLHFQRFLTDASMNRGLPVNKTELSIPMGRVFVRFQLEGRLTMKERRLLCMVIYRQLRPLLIHVDFQSIRHSDARNLNEWRDMNRQINPKRGLDLSTALGRNGFALRMKRLELNWTQTKCANVLNMNRTHLSEIEQGHVAMSVATKSKISRLFNLALE